MATARAMLERRRSSRVPISIPVKISSSAPNEQIHASAEAIAVSRCGALLRVPFSPELGSRLDILHGHSQETREARVVRVTPSQADGLFDLGVEILYPGRNFWGVQFPDEIHSR
jgi:hypothetical protein